MNVNNHIANWAQIGLCGCINLRLVTRRQLLFEGKDSGASNVWDLPEYRVLAVSEIICFGYFRWFSIHLSVAVVPVCG